MGDLTNAIFRSSRWIHRIQPDDPSVEAGLDALRQLRAEIEKTQESAQRRWKAAVQLIAENAVEKRHVQAAQVWLTCLEEEIRSRQEKAAAVVSAGAS